MPRRGRPAVFSLRALLLALVVWLCPSTARAAPCRYTLGYFHYVISAGGLVLRARSLPGNGNEPAPLLVQLCERGKFRAAPLPEALTASSGDGFPDGIPKELVSREGCWTPTFALPSEGTLQVWDELARGGAAYLCHDGQLLPQ